MPQKTALLLGGSGLTGGHCLNYLLNDAHYKQVRALVRRPLSVEHPKLIQQQVDFNQLNDCLADMQINDVYCCLGTTIKKAGSQKAFYEVDFVYPTEIAKLSLPMAQNSFCLSAHWGQIQGLRYSIIASRVKLKKRLAGMALRGFTFFVHLCCWERGRKDARLKNSGKTFSNGFLFFSKGVCKNTSPLKAGPLPLQW